MPRNRQHIPRDERAAELLRAATDVFVAKGYAAATMADISEAASVARANVYWYYSSKDDIFAAVMDRLYSATVDDLTEGQSDLDAYARLTLGLKQLYPFRWLHLAMHERIPHSAAVQGVHESFMSWIRQLVYEVVDGAGADIDKSLLADVIVATFEGARAPTETRPANELIPFILELVIGPVPRDGRRREAPRHRDGDVTRAGRPPQRPQVR